MNKQFKRQIKHYIREVKGYLICDFCTKRRFIKDLKSDIDNYIAENDILSIEEVTGHFGTPKDIAISFFETVDIKRVKRRMNISRIILLGVLAVIIIWGIGVTASVINSYSNNISYEVVEWDD
ncbi:MAG: DUF6120 family protein [Acutalibacteraceae bacterium]